MKLTVGPLPASVYWRRRAVVLGGVLVLVALMFYSCGGGGSDNAGSESGGKRKGSSSPFTYPSERPSEQPPEDGGDPSAPPGSGSPPFGGGGTGPGGAADAPACAEGDLSIRPEPAHTRTPEGARLRIDLVITNDSDRACKADIGADRQEVRLMDGQRRVWSSDDCKPREGTQVEVLSPGVPIERFWVTWDGRSSAPKCGGDRAVVGEGTYTVVARLDQISSDPVTVKVVAT